MIGIKSNNIFCYDSIIKREHRERILNQKGKLIWITGFSGAGKSTMASALEVELYNMGKLTYILDGDNMRNGLNSDLGFSEEDRSENIRRVAEVSKLFVDAGIIIIAAFISPFRKDRNKIRNLIGKDYVEVFANCPIEICEQRDPKGLYSKIRNGQIKNFTGIDAVYEEPENPDITINTYEHNVEECVQSIISYIRDDI
ncbi:adenylylsulfate kinase [Clostridium beijerinckii]|uniref:Adenylyl-sulfate kinase n=1 Tax=Clostridium beijerinckii TaxID=1520 RepID=A0AAX0B0T4_CLOBE|nr:adenylyl-sulfate kinase [Clostridium beijerinckii]NRT88952.1 adenylylsulfate kinase [Clostridium beijerinckii]NYC74407.1 adenylylsulfate kinase [Clostridium beijerinckii]